MIELEQLTVDAGESLGAIGVSSETVLALVEAVARLRAVSNAFHADHSTDFDHCSNAVCATNRGILAGFDFGGVR